MGNTRKKLQWTIVSRSEPSIRSTMVNEFQEDRLLEDREPEALPEEPIENYALLEEQSKQNSWISNPIKCKPNLKKSSTLWTKHRVRIKAQLDATKTLNLSQPLPFLICLLTPSIWGQVLLFNPWP